MDSEDDNPIWCMRHESSSATHCTLQDMAQQSLPLEPEDMPRRRRLSIGSELSECLGSDMLQPTSSASIGAANKLRSASIGGNRCARRVSTLGRQATTAIHNTVLAADFNNQNQQRALEQRHEELVARLKIRAHSGRHGSSTGFTIIDQSRKKKGAISLRGDDGSEDESMPGIKPLRRSPTDDSLPDVSEALPVLPRLMRQIDLKQWYQRYLRLLSGNTPARRILNGFVLVATLYFVVAVPFHLSFSHLTSNTDRLLDLVCWLLYLVDLVLGFTTSQTDEGLNNMTWRKVVRRYAKGFMVADLIAALPYEEIARGLSSVSSDGNQHVQNRFRFLLFLRCVKAVKLPFLFRSAQVCAHIHWI